VIIERSSQAGDKNPKESEKNPKGSKKDKDAANSLISTQNPIAKVFQRLTQSLTKHQQQSLKFGGLALMLIAISGGLGAGLATVLTSKPLQGKVLSREEALAFANSSDITANSLGIPTLSQPVNILVLGTIVLTSDLAGGVNLPKGKAFDEVDSSLEGQSDAMMLVRFEPMTNKLVILSVPRDTRVEIEGAGVQKINAANYVGGAALSAKTTSALLGNVPIDRYLRVNVGGFGQLIDALGGVEIYVPKRMKYQDDSQHLYINLNEGKQVLDGKKAIQYMRYRHDDLGDIGRVQRQQTLMRSLMEQKLNLATVAKIPDILHVLKRNVDTNLSLEEILAVSAFAAKVGRANTKMLMVPGRFSTADEFALSYWLVDQAGALKLMSSYFNLPKRTLVSPSPTTSNTTLRVAIQDSLKSTEATKKATQIFSKLGYEDVRIGEHPWTVAIEKTQIVAQNGDMAMAQAVRDRLGLGEVVVEATGELQSDVTVRLGKDWLTFKPDYKSQSNSLNNLPSKSTELPGANPG
jgi:polyisoprenyl-teichoic acid--peptidoglycan teichoic acid transferase